MTLFSVYSPVSLKLVLYLKKPPLLSSDTALNSLLPCTVTVLQSGDRRQADRFSVVLERHALCTFSLSSLWQHRESESRHQRVYRPTF